jgi:hypothetical protein
VSDSSEILDFLRARFTWLDDRLDRIDRKLDEVVTRLGVLDRRLDRIERRLELADGAVLPTS